MKAKTVGGIKFMILSPEMIRKMSAVEITSSETYDEDGFPIEGGLMDPHLGVIDPGLRCKTCGQRMHKCPGHFGHLELVRPVVHTLFVKFVDGFMRATCKKCGRVVLTEKEIEKLKKVPKRRRLRAAASRGDKVEKCPHCGAERRKIIFEKPWFFYEVTEEGQRRIWPNEIREWFEKIPDEDVALLGFDPKTFRPEWLILTVLPIPPVTIRPSIILETGERSEDDLTHKLVDIVRTNQRLRENIEAGAPQLIIEDLWNLLQYHVTTYFSNQTSGIPPARHRSGRPLRTLLERLSGKEGRFRYNLAGKRVNYAGRSVIIPDPSLSLNEVGVPEVFAEIITIPFHVNEWNLEEARWLVLEGEAKYVIRPDGTRIKVIDRNRENLANELGPGYIIERKVRNGDIVLFNRQPSLHRMSMMAHKVRIVPGKALRISPPACNPYNADFDGDEMNIHFLQTWEARVEANELMLVEKHILSPRYGAPVIGFDEEYVTGAFLLSKKETVLSRKEAMELLYRIGITDIPDKEEITGKELISLLLPKNLNVEFASTLCSIIVDAGLCDKAKCKKEKCPYDAYVKIENGKLVCGVLDEAAIGAGVNKGHLIDEICRLYGPSRAREFIDQFGKLVLAFITKKGFTYDLTDIETPEGAKKEIRKIVEEAIREGEEIIKLYREGKLEPIPGRTLQESVELRLMAIGQKATKEVEKIVMREALKEYLKGRLHGGLEMTISGARGSTRNVNNLAGIYGQTAVREWRPSRGYFERVLPHFKRGDIGLVARGFVISNLRDGLDPRELFFASMGGRQGEVDKAVSTQISGYLYRRLAYALMDLRVYYDGTVREATTGDIVQFVYGDDGIFPSKTKRGVAFLEQILKEVEYGAPERA